MVRMRLAVALLLVVTACGGDDADSYADRIAAADSCDTMNELFFEMFQTEILDVLGPLSPEDATAREDEVNEAFSATNARWLAKQSSLGCTDAGVRDYTCANADQLDPRGPAGGVYVSQILEQSGC